jgi:hypothetical protein
VEPIDVRRRPKGMTIALRSAPALALLLALTACAERGAAGGPADPDPTAAPATSGLVLRVEYTGGFLTPATIAARLPSVSVYADGRMITQGPVPAIWPGPALPNLQVTELDPAAVQDLVDRALAAGVAGTADLGMPPVADAPSTRFTLVTTEATYQREVYALGGTPEGSGLTPEQEETRGRLYDLLASMPSADGVTTSPYAAGSVAAVVTPWIDPQDGLVQPELPWPGPALPGEPTGGPPDVTCVTATGAQAEDMVRSARTANAATPWATGDGLRWTVVFRPLLPDETGCADLTA